ncbi:MAG: thiamine pyrophosphate-dependent dehydrogenase E1 component subunit alpha [Chloroflexi bacterium]|nr:thiamine pyrophosphate-dependent dehydrogenase E1 component subunit alpha [Chloroflexota bacterium]
MPADVWALYEAMLRSRLFETEVSQLWGRGLISGEMHLGTGEEAICAGIVSQLHDGDALALDHRATPALLMRGVNPVALLREFLGREDGLCRGHGGHMHLFAPELLAASTGIVGATGPMAAGFALAAQHLRPGCVAVAFFGEGAMNEGAPLEALNLAVVWRLPVVFVCKDNDWSITTHSPSTTGGNLADRARSFGAYTVEIDGTDVSAVYDAAEACLQRARAGAGPSFILARCTHLDGHYLGDTLLAAARQPMRVLGPMALPLARSALQLHGAALRERLDALVDILTRSRRATAAIRQRVDPLDRARQNLLADPVRLNSLESRVAAETRAIVEVALESASGSPQP